jgi:hypothetical protein
MLVTYKDSGTIMDPKLAKLWEYWNTKRGTRLMPARADLDPLEIPRLLPVVYLLDVLHDPLRFRVRLVGTAVREFAGEDFTGQPVDENLYDNRADDAVDVLKQVVERKAPIAVRGNAIFEQGREWQKNEALIMPLSSDGVTVDMLLGANGPATQFEEDPNDIPDAPGLTVFLNPVFKPVG